jgi:hypothetical protein
VNGSYARIYKAVEKAKRQLHVLDFNLAPPTLEEVFHNFASEQVTPEDEVSVSLVKRSGLDSLAACIKAEVEEEDALWPPSEDSDFESCGSIEDHKSDIWGEADLEEPVRRGEDWQRQGSLFFADCPEFYDELKPGHTFPDLSDDDWDDIEFADTTTEASTRSESRASARTPSNRAFSEVFLEEDFHDLL